MAISPHHEEPPQGGVSNGDYALRAPLRMRVICAYVIDGRWKIPLILSEVEGSGPRRAAAQFRHTL